VINSTIFSNETQLQGGNIINGPIYYPGTVRIDDVISSYEYGPISDIPEKNFLNLETFKKAVIELAKNVPVVGKFFEKGENIYSWVKALNSDVEKLIDPYDTITHESSYSYRNFYHDLYVWDNNDTWYEAGYSQSRYYYYWGEIWYHTKDGKLKRSFYDQADDIGNPVDILEAKHYKDYQWLRDRAKYEWQKRGRYIENWSFPL
jgi:hypothetical protein